MSNKRRRKAFAAWLERVLACGALALVVLGTGCGREAAGGEAADRELSAFAQTEWLTNTFANLLCNGGYEYRQEGYEFWRRLDRAVRTDRFRAIVVTTERRDRLLRQYYDAVTDELADMEAEVNSSSGLVLGEESHFEIDYDYHGAKGRLRVVFALDGAGYIDVTIDHTERLR
ncbi:MAG: hypothetical protein JJU33_09620 [Phycisphaerales bacterium]|nr:hypothetical protein [Phycisphaerales bacterium]